MSKKKKDSANADSLPSKALQRLAEQTSEPGSARTETDTLRLIQELQTANAYNRSLIEASLDPMVAIDADGRLIDLNTAAEHAGGRSRAEVIGTDFAEYFTEPEKARAGYRQTFQEGFLRDYLLDLKRPDGQVLSVHCNASVYRGESGQIMGVVATFHDATKYQAESKRTEEIIREDKARFATVINTARDAIILMDVDGSIALWNDSAVQLFGYSAEEALGKNLHRLIAPARYHEDYAKGFAEFRSSGTGNAVGKTLELVAMRKNGDELLVELSLSAVQSKEGWQAVGILRDITERKRHEQRIAKLTRLYAVLSQVDEAIVRARDAEPLFAEVCRIVAERGNFPLCWIGLTKGRQVIPVASWGAAAAYLKEISVELDGVLGGGPTGTCIRENRSDVNDDFAVTPATAPWRETALRYGFRASAAFPLRRQGKAIGALTLYACEPGVFDAEHLGLLESLSADLSYALDSLEQEQIRVQAEKALQESQERLALAIHAGQIGMFAWNLLTGDVFFTSQSEVMFGLAPATAATTTTTTRKYQEWAACVHPDDLPGAQDTLQRCIHEGASFNTQYRVVWPDGSVHWIEASGQPEHDADGRCVRVLGTNVDITERKRVDDAVRRQSHERAVTNELLRLVNQSTTTRELIRDVTVFFQEQSGCEAVGVRLRQGDDYPYYETRGFSKDFLLVESRLCAYDSKGAILRDDEGKASLDCICGNVISGRFDPSKPYYTPGGSFWTNSTTAWVAGTTAADRPTPTRAYCNKVGYESLAQVPLHLGSQRMGLVQFNDHQPGKFTPEIIAFWEHLANQLAIGVAKLETDEALRESEERFRLAIKATNDAIWDINLAKGIAHCNETYAAAFGRLPETGDSIQWWTDRIHPEDRDRTTATFRAALEGQETAWTSEYRFLRSDGAWANVCDRAFIARDASGKASRVIGAMLDITQRRHAEERQLALQKRLEGLNRLQEDLLLRESLEQKCKRITETAVKLLDLDFCRIWHLQPGDLCNTGCIHAAATEEEYACRNREQCLHLVASDGRYTHTDGNHHRVPFGCYEIGRIASGEVDKLLTNNVTTDPQVHDHEWAQRLGLVSLAGYRLHNGGGKPMGVLVVFSKHPLLEEDDAFLSSLAETTSRVFLDDQAAKEIQQAQQHAIAASQSKSTFLANMSHEIRTPLNGILGMTQLLQETTMTAEQRQYLEAIQASGNSLLEIINDILDFSRIEAGKMELEVIEFDLRERLSDAMDTVAMRAQEKGLELTLHVHGEVPEVLQGDPLRLRQVVLNLLGNAIKFTEKGEVSAEVSVDALAQDNCVLHFTVADTGMGIAAEKQESLFAAFVQGDDSLTRSHGGTGLGLAIARELTHKMGGTIWVDSEPGRGSRFQFTASFALATQPPRTTTPSSLVDLRVLAVASNAIGRLALEDMLTQWHMKPTAVHCGQAALDALSQARDAGQSFSLILLDASLADLDGFVLAEQIKRDPGLATPMIMLLSWARRTENAARCRALGIEACLTKPLRPSAVLDTVVKAVANHAHPPLAAAKPQEPAQQIKTVTPRATTAHILLVEDNTINQLFAARLLERHGYEVCLAANGKEALAHLRTQAFDLVLMDLQMPEMDGFEATAAIRQSETLPGGHVPIIAMTAHALKGDDQRCLAAGMDGYVSKPITAGDLFRVVEETLAASRGPGNAV